MIGKLRTWMVRSVWLAGFTGSRLTAAAILLGVKLSPGHVWRAAYRGAWFYFRGRDLSALQEVLTAQEYAFLRPYMAGTPTILDIGAHIGLFALWALQENPATRLLSVEASPETFALLARNAARNADWRTLHCAACDGEHLVSLSDSATETMSHRLTEGGKVQVSGIGLATLLELVGGRADLIKVDIEGAEELFIAADPDALRHVSMLVIELHPKLCDATRVEAILRAEFPVVEVIGGRTSSKPLLFCRRESHG